MKNSRRLVIVVLLLLFGGWALAETTGGTGVESIPSYYPWLGMLMAVLASTNANVGKGLQKWKVRVFGKGRAMFQRENIGDLGIWLIGFALAVSSVPLFSFALKFTTKPSQVSSLNGVGLIGLAIFAWLALRERIGRQEIAGIILVLIGTTVMGYYEENLFSEQHYHLTNFILSSGAFLIVFGALAAFSWKARILHGFSFGALPGVFIGIGLILGDMALVKAGGSILGQLKNIYPWLAVLCGLLALITSQLAFWRARAIIVVPTTNSFVILTPVIIQYFTFHAMLRPVQYLAVAVIVLGVIFLTYTEKQERIEGLVKENEDEAEERAKDP